MTDHTYAGHTLAKIKAAAEAATSGPWRWELNEKHRSIILSGGKPTFDKYVMDFARWGMGGAAPRFNDAVASGEYNIMERVEKYGTKVKGREHHADWFKDVDHPDARFIATANPATVLAMAARIEELELVAERNELLWAGWKEKAKELERERDAAQNFANCAKLELERVQDERDAAIEARREAQQELVQAREDRNRLGVVAERRAHETADQYRLEGWQAAREMAAKVCDDHATDRWNLYKGRAPYDGSEDGRTHLQTQGENIGAEFCADSIRAMQAQAEWGGAQNGINTPESPVVTGNGVVTDWPHPDGFAGGLTERN